MFINAHSGAVAAKRQLTIIVMIQGSSAEDSLSHCKAELPPIPRSLPHTLYAAIPINCMPASSQEGGPWQTSADLGRPWQTLAFTKGLGMGRSGNVSWCSAAAE
jgi:hypothetical protein